MKKIFLITCLVLAVFSLKAQEEITVKFTSTTQIGAYCPFNAVNVSNLSRGWDEVLYYPDTTLSLACSVGLSEMIEISPITVYPNPFSNSTNASFSLETDAIVKIQLFQLNGKEIASFVEYYEAGEIQIRVAMSEPQMALLVITTANSRQVAKILNVGNGNCNSIEATHYASKKGPDGSKANLIGDFMPGDTMRYEAVAYDNGNMLTSEIFTKAQYEDETIALEFVVTIPDVNTFEVSNITQTSALGGGEVTMTGGLPVTERGICWGTAHNPTISQNHNSNGSGIGAYSVNMYGLVQNTTYYVRAYAINGVGISYGNEVQFTTSLNVSAPTVMTSQVTSVTQTSAVGGGNVTDDGGASVTERGICWGTGHNPSINNNHSSNGSGLGSYTVNMTGLSAGTTYYVRAYAINSQGISYGQEVSFTTTAFPPTVTTSQVTEITQTSAIGGGNVTDDGGGTVTERGICWSTSHNPTTSSSHGNSGSGTGSFSVNMSGLSANTTYYVRAYAINNADTAYGSEVSFTTLQNVSLPTVTTSQVTNITQTTATGGGNVTSDGGGTVTERGICWSTSHNPTTSGNHANNGTGTGSYTINMTGLTANTTYYVRAYATNSVGTAYGSEVSFITSQATPTYTITVSANPSMAGSVSGGGSYQQGQSCTVTATATSGYTFVRWTENGTQVSTNASYTFTVTSNRTLVANFNLNGGGSHEYVNLGLPSGTLWATCNVGASSPEDYGAYFAWGETQLKDVYNWSTYVYCHGTGTTLTKYCNNSSYGYNGFTDNLTTLLSVDDAATANWGADWRMPTSEEWSELQDNTTATWTTQNGVYGWLLTATNGNSLFLPAAGGYGDNGPVNPGTDGGYWSSSLCTSDPSHAWYYYFWSGFGEVWDWSRDFGRSVRAVFNSAPSVTLPTVTTSQVTNITQTTATGGGNVTNDGGGTVTERGICWSTSHNPTTSGNHANSGTGTGSYSINMTGLTANTTYYVRAYATNSAGTAYGSEVSFTTLQNASLPTVTTSQVTNITQTTATGGGNVTATGGSNVTERGICWSTSHNPTTSGNHANSGIGTGIFTINMTGLTANTTYYVRAYAMNSAGTAYGSEVSFTTLQNASLPTVTTSQVTNITQTSATGGGNVTSSGGGTVSERGICWSTSHNPTTSGNHANSGTGTGSYSINMTGLTANTTYYVRAFATNSAGTAYGSEVSFTTLQNASLPTVTTSQVTNISQTTATGGGNVTATGGSNVTERGICWSTSHNPTTSGSHGSSGTGTGSYTVSMTGLTANTTYYVRAYATNSAGTAYGSEESFTTSQNVTLPTVTTNQVTNITQTTATGGGDVTSDGGATVTERGICWSTSHNPTISGSHGSSGTGTGSYTVSMTGLTANTTYYVRAYATNSVGTAYGSEVSFTTSQNVTLPTVTTSQVTNITETSATGGGNVISDGGGIISIRGICWSTSHNPTTNNNHYNLSGATGSFSINMNNLTANTTYYVRAYATNGAGTAYGNEVSFTTLPHVTLPTVTTIQVTDIAQTTATGGGNVIDSGNATVTERGICWSTNHDPTTSSNHASSGNGIGSYTINMTDLTANTTYYVRAYAINSVGTAYGNEVSFTTSQVPPSYTITVSADPNIGGSVSGSGIYQKYQSCTVTAMAAAGYTFTKWTEDGTQVSTNASYTFTVYTNRTLVAHFTSYEYVDLGLPSGTLWATCNVGATAPEGYGDYFAWGEIQPKAIYNWNTYQYCMGNSSSLTKYCPHSSNQYGYNGFYDILTILQPGDDAATVNWDANWRMPTKEEWNELYVYTTHTWTSQNGVEGFRFTASNGNTLFLPAAGCRHESSLVYDSLAGYYWSSTLYTVVPCNAWYSYFDYDSFTVYDIIGRYYGMSVRAVLSVQ